MRDSERKRHVWPRQGEGRGGGMGPGIQIRNGESGGQKQETVTGADAQIDKDVQYC